MSLDPVKQTLRTASWVTKRQPTTPPVTGQYLEHAFGQSGLQAELADANRRERRQGCGFQDDRIAGRQGRCESPAGDGHGEVPRDDDAHDTEWLVEREVDAARDGDLLATVTFRCAGVVREDVTDVASLPASVANRVSGVRHFQLRQLFDVLVDDVGEATKETRPVAGRDGAPRRTGLLGAKYRTVGGVEIKEFDRRDWLLVRRIEGRRGRS